jgi:hypothetical protein
MEGTAGRRDSRKGVKTRRGEKGITTKARRGEGGGGLDRINRMVRMMGERIPYAKARRARRGEDSDRIDRMGRMQAGRLRYKGVRMSAAWLSVGGIWFGAGVGFLAEDVEDGADGEVFGFFDVLEARELYSLGAGFLEELADAFLDALTEELFGDFFDERRQVHFAEGGGEATATNGDFDSDVVGGKQPHVVV